MKGFPIAVACLLAACEKPEPEVDLEASRMRILEIATKERDKAERRVADLEALIRGQETKIAILENRVKLAQDACALYERLLDDSNEAKLERARRMLSELRGTD